MEPSAVTTVPETQSRKNSSGMVGWMKFIGIMTIIGGALQVLSIVGIAIAWLPIWLGVIMVQAASRAKDYADKGDEASLAAMTGKLKTYFTISGILMIVSLVVGIVASIVWVVLIAAGMMPAWESLLDRVRGN
jgi:hypothetical protein